MKNGFLMFQDLSGLDCRDGRLFLDGVDLVEIGRRYGTPTFVFSERSIIANLEKIKAAYQYPEVPVRIFYASKANSNLAVLQIIREQGVGIDVSSLGELMKARAAGFEPQQIILNGPGKTLEEIALALDERILCINVDSACELDRILEVARQKQVSAPVALRVVPGIICGTKKGIESGSAYSKFGMEIEEVAPLLEKIARNEEFLNFCGFHVHIGSQVTAVEPFKKAFESLLDLAEAWSARLGKKLLIDLGGGFPIAYSTHSIEDVSEEANTIFQGKLSLESVAEATIGELIRSRPNQLGCFEFAIEPGRRTVANAAVLLTRVEGMKYRPSLAEHWLILDSGFNVLLENFDYKWYFRLVSVSRAAEPHSQLFRVGGPLCDGGDVFFDIDGKKNLPERRPLPASTGPDDYVAFLDAGAYTLEQMSTYNGRFRAAAVLIRENGEVCLIRRRDTFEDLIAQDIMVEMRSSELPLPWTESESCKTTL